MKCFAGLSCHRCVQQRTAGVDNRGPHGNVCRSERDGEPCSTNYGLMVSEIHVVYSLIPSINYIHDKGSEVVHH